MITALGGKSVDDSSALSSLVDEHKAGDSVEVKITRSGKQQTLTIKLGQRPTTTEKTQTQQAPQQEQPQQEVPGFGGGW